MGSIDVDSSVFTCVDDLTSTVLSTEVEMSVMMTLKDFNSESEDQLKYVDPAMNPYPKYKIMSEKHLLLEIRLKQ